MTHTTQTTARYVGIDVSQKTLTIAIYPTDEVWTIDNTREHHTALVQHLAHLPIQRVLLESSGGYEKAVVSALQQAGLPVVVVPAQRARYFAKSMRGDLKTDRADARMLAYFACCYPVQPVAPCSPVQAELKELWARREQLVQQVEREKKRLQTVQSEAVRASLARMLAVLKDEIAQIEARVEELIASDAALAQKAALLQTAVGVGRVVAYGLVAELPELGQVSHRAIAALAGLAPVRCESGDWVGRARVRGGRPRVRRLLYQAAVVASTHDGRWRAVYEGLLGRRKVKKVALCAVARQLLVVLNAMVRDGRAYERVQA
ncbi:IS110 family transposase [Fischerella thermalis]|uniref:IS110 family transposase n=1 Tax=Fischerella thermalis CCMEE 5318 TaxID=2019666 RepID=A0A2N6LC40_9CYAN|nr:IS110 family transposase [Fischerella thermalis]PMB20391.1 IS110 family transposase [Fischerella thermalis CCMEE 5318]